jgi:signal recognition particle receptor subunit beta
MAVYKIFVHGPPEAGKTETIKAVSDLPLVSAAKKIPLTQNTITLDYGRVHIRPHMCYLYGPAGELIKGQNWLGIAKEMDALLYVVDGTSKTLGPAYELLESLTDSWSSPVLVGVNGIGRSDYSEDSYLEVVSVLGASYAVYPFDAIVRSSALTVVRAVIAILDGVSST